MYFYPRSPCGERLFRVAVFEHSIVISIHALLAESDWRSSKTARRFRYFYPRSPCGERQLTARDDLTHAVFLSTLSLRRATLAVPDLGKRDVRISIHALLAESDGKADIRNSLNNNFYPRSPCGERLPENGLSPVGTKFLSTLSLRRATYVFAAGNKAGAFLSTLSLRRATTIRTGPCTDLQISIHALLAESDIGAITYVVMTPDFYPRSPCGERPVGIKHFQFQRVISIHALLAESDQSRSRKTGRRPPFLSTLSLRRATMTCKCLKLYRKFLSTLSLRRATVTLPDTGAYVNLFLSTLSLRRATPVMQCPGRPP